MRAAAETVFAIDLGAGASMDLGGLTLYVDRFDNAGSFSNGMIIVADAGAVPEPPTWMLVLAGLAGLSRRRRRR